MKSPIELLRALLDDTRRLEPDVKGIDRDIVSIEVRFKHEGYGFLTVALPSLCDALDQGLSLGRFTCPHGFKSIRGGALPRLFSGLLCEVFALSSGLLKENPNLGVVKSLREVLRLFKKLKLDQSSEEILDRKACLEFFENDDKCRQDYPTDMTHHLEQVSKFLLSDLFSHDPASLTYRHGPGAVHESVKNNQKWSFLVEAIREDRFNTEKFGFSDFAFSMSESQDSFLKSRAIQVDDSGAPSVRASSSIAKLISVAKNSTSRRTITIEPLLNQFVQQGFNTVLRSCILRCPVLRHCLALSDQSKNQVLAMEGSLTDEWATIDLKSASDLLSLQLVKIVFGRHRGFIDSAIECRSSEVKYKQLVKTITKFAGMGNALTFPIQSVVFASLAIAAVLYQDGNRPSIGRLKRAARLVRVYGDDIIVHTDYAQQVVVWLQSFGLTVNRKKSFLAGNFKESCGVDAYKGVDVTPLYCRFRPDDASVEPDAIAGLVSLSNQAWLRGLYKFSTTLKDEVENRLRRRLPLCSSRSSALGWHTRQGWSDIHSWNRHLHRFEQRSYVQVPLKRRDELDGSAALLKFFLTPATRCPVTGIYMAETRVRDHLQKSPVRFNSRLVQRRVPA